MASAVQTQVFSLSGRDAPRRAESLSVGRIGRVEKVAHAVAFLASPLADFIDGADSRVAGGYVTAIN